MTTGDPSPEPAAARLLGLAHTFEEVAARSRLIYDAVLARSQQIRTGNFTRIGTTDLELLFELYDTHVFEGFLTERLRDRHVDRVHFRLSRRMTRAAGTTALRRVRRGSMQGVEEYTITISTTLLFGTFRESAREITVGGIVVRDRLEALQRIYEHELLHLAEFLVWGRSNCRAENFQALSRRIFAHEAAHHDLVTPRERAATEHGIQVGDAVRFAFDGTAHHGIVNRITQRATVLVPHPAGRLYSNGQTYLTYYVPLDQLTRVASEPG